METLGALSRRYDRWRTERFLRGRRFMSPTWKNQTLWARTLAPDVALLPDDDAWDTLRRFTLPLIRRYGSRAHNLGLARLPLERPPELAALAVNGWTVTKVDGEVSPPHFFSLLARRIFPAVERVRPLSEVFCGSQPDLWHEAVGHVASLADPELADFYQWCGEIVCRNPARARELAKILWVVLEYGFLREPDGLKTFGAALTGSFMGLQRFAGGYLAHAPFDPAAVLRSGLYEEGRPAPRDARGRIVFFALDSREGAKRLLLDYL